MQTFKQVMGFVLLGTVVYLLSFLSVPYVLPTLTLSPTREKGEPRLMLALTLESPTVTNRRLTVRR